MGDGRAIDGIVGEETCMPRSASSASNPDSVETPGENAWAMPSRSSGTKITAVTVGADANELDAGVERPQRFE